MKLIGYSIIGGFIGLILASVVLNIGGNINTFGISLFGIVGFFSPGLYVINKLYDKSKKENIKENIKE